jgi:hypothetical protein
MSKFVAQPEDEIIIRGEGQVKVRKSHEEMQESSEVEPEAQDKSR